MNARKRRTSNAGLHLVVGLLQEIRRRLRSEDGFDDLTEYRDLIDEDATLHLHHTPGRRTTTLDVIALARGVYVLHLCANATARTYGLTVVQ